MHYSSETRPFLDSFTAICLFVSRLHFLLHACIESWKQGMITLGGIPGMQHRDLTQLCSKVSGGLGSMQGEQLTSSQHEQRGRG